MFRGQVNWALIYLRRARLIDVSSLLKDHEELVISLGDKTRIGMFYVKLVWTLEFMQRLRESYQYLQKALELGEEIKDEKIIAYSCAWLTYACNDLGLLDDAVAYGKRVQDSDLYMSDLILFRQSTTSMAATYWFRGDIKNTMAKADVLIEYGQSHSDMLCISLGYIMRGRSHMSAGDITSSIENAQKSVPYAVEPIFFVSANMFLGEAYLANGQYQEAEKVLQEVRKVTESNGFAFIGTLANILQDFIMIIRGDISQGIEMIEAVMALLFKSERRYRYAFCNYTLGKVYLQIVQGGGGKKDFSFLAKNIGFMIKTVPFAHQKAEKHFNIAINTAKEIGAKGVLAQAYFDMGRLRQTKGKTDEARKYITDAIQLFEECEADVYLKQAREALASLD